jgi:hypothetical protein
MATSRHRSPADRLPVRCWGCDTGLLRLSHCVSLRDGLSTGRQLDNDSALSKNTQVGVLAGLKPVAVAGCFSSWTNLSLFVHNGIHA